MFKAGEQKGLNAVGTCQSPCVGDNYAQAAPVGPADKLHYVWTCGLLSIRAVGVVYSACPMFQDRREAVGKFSGSRCAGWHLSSSTAAE